MQYLLNQKPLVLTASIFILTALILGCTSSDSPTEAYKRLYSAVKSKDTEAIKAQVSKKTTELAAMSAQRFNKSIESSYENGFTATTFAETLPETRDERVNGNMGAVEVWNARDKKWEDLPFIFEDGAWKLAMGDVFAGTYESPGKGRDILEREAANAVSNRNVILPLGNQANSKTAVGNSNKPSPK